MAIMLLFLAWTFTSALFIMLGCPDILAAILGLAGPAGLIWLCVRAYDPSKDVIQQGHENFHRMEQDRITLWTEEAQREDCWYRGGGIVAPQHGYWSDGSIKVDRWTGKTFPKGMYFLNSRGQNAVLLDVPSDAKRCPG